MAIAPKSVGGVNLGKRARHRGAPHSVRKASRAALREAFGSDTAAAPKGTPVAASEAETLSLFRRSKLLLLCVFVSLW